MVTREGKSLHAIGLGTIEKSKPTLRKNGEGWAARQLRKNRRRTDHASGETGRKQRGAELGTLALSNKQVKDSGICGLPLVLAVLRWTTLVVFGDPHG